MYIYIMNKYLRSVKKITKSLIPFKLTKSRKKSKKPKQVKRKMSKRKMPKRKMSKRKMKGGS